MKEDMKNQTLKNQLKSHRHLYNWSVIEMSVIVLVGIFQIYSLKNLL